ncbi:hypothetical protein [Streptacidiphilus rugosus]|uniref:hypothetical protein n=1 Tax=Streptacidiphilus rugosus TaxID=405783 RepID=UPI000559CB9E|nr:hypothetical protein [Streptacidiphilus rugosus]
MNQGPQSELRLAELIAQSFLSTSTSSGDDLLIEALEGAPLQAARACFPPCAVCGVDVEDSWSEMRPTASTRELVLR